MESNDSAALCNLLRWLCEANCWGLIAGIDQLDYNVLSPVTTYFQEISKAQTMRMQQFYLGGRMTNNLGFDAAVFFKTRTGTCDSCTINIQFSIQQLAYVIKLFYDCCSR
jgi:hypothetical protein